MTDDEIIKALECCITIDVGGCKDCPYRHEECINRIMTDALDLINRQKAEIERLKAENAKLKHEMSYMTRPNTIGDAHEMGAW